MRVKHCSTRNKSLGQNFLTDAALLDQLVELSGVTASDAVLEIGAGLGGLTVALAKRARRVLAVEIDRSLERELRAAVSLYPHVEIRIMDGMALDWPAWINAAGRPIWFLSNLPYCMTTPLLLRSFRMDPPFDGVACMMQEEVARRLCASPGGEGYGPLSVWSRARFTPRVVLDVPARMFDPPPEVDSCFVVCSALDEPMLTPGDYARFGRVVDAAFAARRKTLRNNLRAGFGMTSGQAGVLLEKVGLDERVRAEDVSPAQFVGIMGLI
ncbi:MAG: 16S rRNA (adenine(1518)-N(6)/adenine(1519)-N(6))-dimethyltransferase RsmA [Oscillospiraceae bacterium]|jgi:16S rRNA (adenine1518-N6/adenine1519-N6)-dimethyltransferase|nr:16S rRNA (adenine(1518)-N(6)/adenine(1519)-N(6))-dimethyltransferase RsmA [Oscillospiraceae bacterium]